jgi:hypothetical protein
MPPKNRANPATERAKIIIAHKPPVRAKVGEVLRRARGIPASSHSPSSTFSAFAEASAGGDVVGSGIDEDMGKPPAEEQKRGIIDSLFGTIESRGLKLP